jgi:hypothetical protein
MNAAERRLIAGLVSAIIAAAIALVFVLHILTLERQKLRGLDFDESQYLHVAWEMHGGARLYRDFVEDHSPFLFLVLAQLLPDDAPLSGPNFDPFSFAVRGRIFIGLCGIGAAICAALVARAVSRSWLAALVVAIGVFAPAAMWRDAAANIRNDPPTLFLFWLGALLLLLRRADEDETSIGVLLRGSVGVGLAFTAAVWNPKWPACCLVLGVVHLIRLIRAPHWTAKRIAAAVLSAATIAAAAVLAIVRTVSLGDYYFFTFTFNREIGAWFAQRPQLTGPYFAGGLPSSRRSRCCSFRRFAAARPSIDAPSGSCCRSSRRRSSRSASSFRTRISGRSTTCSGASRLSCSTRSLSSDSFA